MSSAILLFLGCRSWGKPNSLMHKATHQGGCLSSDSVWHWRTDPMAKIIRDPLYFTYKWWIVWGLKLLAVKCIWIEISDTVPYLRPPIQCLLLYLSVLEFCPVRGASHWLADRQYRVTVKSMDNRARLGSSPASTTHWPLQPWGLHPLCASSLMHSKDDNTSYLREL